MSYFTLSIFGMVVSLTLAWCFRWVLAPDDIKRLLCVDLASDCFFGIGFVPNHLIWVFGSGSDGVASGQENPPPRAMERRFRINFLWPFMGFCGPAETSNSGSGNNNSGDGNQRSGRGRDHVMVMRWKKTLIKDKSV
ncbi:Zinc finger, RING/FYVE/PHD-type [Artemisia annua]|uniref:Zinc finger, RING/FYVE/PHD-type n=1 Tax=Artemisia annua TaxID=35608 RepID=A0A2U1MGN6_ARTAN|nr:Zinc finger, RING/FYVE/PHD-type [Artemisia annua]